MAEKSSIQSGSLEPVTISKVTSIRKNPHCIELQKITRFFFFLYSKIGAKYIAYSHTIFAYSKFVILINS
jgi:hypothetical protein